MKSLLLVLTDGDLWTRKVQGKTVLFWSMEGVRTLAKDCWVHIVYNGKNKSALDKTVAGLGWAKVGDIYSVPRPMPAAYAAMMAFPSFGASDGCYLFDGKTVFAPGLMEYMGNVDWFPYGAAEGAGLDLGEVQPGIPAVITPLGLYSFREYNKLFSHASEDLRDPILIYRELVKTGYITSSRIPTEKFHRVDSLKSIERFSELVTVGKVGAEV
jgi:hypothetical protein